MAAALGLALAGWAYVVHPPALPTSPAEVAAQTPVGTPVYVAVLRPDRTVHVTGVRIAVQSSVAVQVRALACVGGSFEVTTDPSVYCTRLADPSGLDLGSGDTLVVEVTGASPGAAYVDRPEVSYTMGLRRGTRLAGSPAVITLLQR